MGNCLGKKAHSSTTNDTTLKTTPAKVHEDKKKPVAEKTDVVVTSQNTATQSTPSSSTPKNTSTPNGPETSNQPKNSKSSNVPVHKETESFSKKKTRKIV